MFQSDGATESELILFLLVPDDQVDALLCRLLFLLLVGLVVHLVNDDLRSVGHGFVVGHRLYFDVVLALAVVSGHHAGPVVQVGHDFCAGLNLVGDGSVVVTLVVAGGL